MSWLQAISKAFCRLTNWSTRSFVHLLTRQFVHGQQRYCPYLFLVQLKFHRYIIPHAYKSAVLLAWQPVGHGLHYTQSLGIKGCIHRSFNLKVRQRTIFFYNETHDYAPFLFDFLRRLGVSGRLTKILQQCCIASFKAWHQLTYIVNLIVYLNPFGAFVLISNFSRLSGRLVGTTHKSLKV